MGGRRRHGSNSHGIRKSKKKKQVTVRVAERKQAAEERLARKIEDADELLREKRLGQLGIKLGRERTDGQGRIERESEQHIFDPESMEDDPNEMPRDKAYDSLVDQLRVPLEESPATKSHEKSAEKSKKKPIPDKLLGSSPREDRPQVADDGQELPLNATGLPLPEHDKQECEEATSRERLHFASDKGAGGGSHPENKLIAEGRGVRIAGSVCDQTGRRLQKAVSSLSPVSLGILPSMMQKWREHDSLSRLPYPTPLARSFTSALRSFSDILLCAPLSPQEDDAIRALCAVHATNHALRARNRQVRNDLRVRRGEAEDLRDQGFSQARVLLLCPMRNVAYDFVKTVTALARCIGSTDRNFVQVTNSERFEAEFAPDPDEEDDDEDDDIQMNIDSTGSRNKPKRRKPADHQRTFRGNIDDDFKIGISFVKKAVKLYSDFYESDIIIASPLGLRRSSAEKAYGQDMPSRLAREKKRDDEEWKSGIDSKLERRVADDSDYGFLSSIELCFVDSAHVLGMQNWDSLVRALLMVNQIPSKTRGTDFSRVREWCLDGAMKNFRQTVVTSRHKKSEVLSLFRQGTNHAGKIHISRPPKDDGSMSDVVVKLKQTFLKVPDITSVVDAPEKRCIYFMKQLLPVLRSLMNSQCLLIVPEYFNFVRVRNKLLKVSEDDPSFRFASMCEYSRARDVLRARGRLFRNEVDVVAMTERFHFFWRHHFRGVNTVAWYGLPENSEFYPELLNMTAEAVEKGAMAQSFALYDTFDYFSLERIVGKSRCKKMTSENSRSMYLFV